MNLQKILSTVLVGIMGVGPLAAQQSDSSAPEKSGAAQGSNALTIESPGYGQTLTGSSVAVTLRVGSRIRRSSLRVLINGKDLTTLFSTARCNTNGCEEKGNLGALWTGSAVASYWTLEGDPVTPPSYENVFDATLGTLEQNASTYASNLAIGYDQSLDAIYTDWDKLQSTGNATANSDSGWNLPTQVTADGLGAVFAQGSKRSIYLQVIPQYYQMDTYRNQPVSDLSTLGTLFDSVEHTQGTQANYWACSAAYPTAPPSNGYLVYPAPSGVGHDIYVIGGTQSNEGSDNVSENLPSQTLVTTLFDPSALNIPMDQFFANMGLLVERNGPDQGYGQCYKIGCKKTDDSGYCVGP